MAEALDLNIPLGENGAESVEKIIKPLLEVKGESKDKKEDGSIVKDKVANVAIGTSKEEEE